MKILTKKLMAIGISAAMLTMGIAACQAQESEPAVSEVTQASDAQNPAGGQIVGGWEKAYTTDINEDLTGVFEAELHSITTAKDQKLYLDTADAALMKGKKILIVDDVISTGESLSAIENLVKLAGGTICGKMTILAEGDAQDRPDLIYLEKLPLFTKEGKAI